MKRVIWTNPFDRTIVRHRHDREIIGLRIALCVIV